MSLAIQDLTKTFGEQVAVDNISFEAAKGEVVGFLGPNGAGKSTTMKMITGYTAPTSGSISVCDINVSEAPLATKAKIGYLPETNALYPEMYVREYLTLVAGLHGIDQKKNRIEEVLAIVGLLPESHKKIGALSKGYKQRVGIAAAIIHDPEILILDEPTSGLDPNQIQEIRAVIRNLGKDKCVLLSSHIMQEVEAVCDRVIILHKGKIVANDKLENLQSKKQEGVSIFVKFAEEVPEEKLKALPSVKNLYKEQGGYVLSGSKEQELRQAVLQLSVQENYNIETLQSKKIMLEEVFRSLTA